MATSFTSEKLMEAVRFPFEDKKWVEKLFIAAVMLIGSFLIIPALFYMGYSYELQRRMIVDGEKPSLPEWDNWGTYLKNGFKMIAVQIIYTLPYLIVVLPILFSFLFLLIKSAVSENPAPYFLPIPVLMILLGVVTVFGYPLILVIKAAQGRLIATGSFEEALHLSEVWLIFRSNLGGYVLTFVLYMAATYVVSFVAQIMIYTIILIIVVPFFLYPLSLYLSLAADAMFARAYIESRERIRNEEESED